MGKRKKKEVVEEEEEAECIHEDPSSLMILGMLPKYGAALVVCMRCGKDFTAECSIANI